jgi:hypothetical protein
MKKVNRKSIVKAMLINAKIDDKNNWLLVLFLFIKT